MGSLSCILHLKLETLDGGVLPEVPEEDMRQMLARWEQEGRERRAEARLQLDGRVAVEELSENRLSTYGQEAAVLRYALRMLRQAQADPQKIAVMESVLEILGRQWLMDELACARAKGIQYPDMEELLEGILTSTSSR